MVRKSQPDPFTNSTCSVSPKALSNVPLTEVLPPPCSTRSASWPSK